MGRRKFPPAVVVSSRCNGTFNGRRCTNLCEGQFCTACAPMSSQDLYARGLDPQAQTLLTRLSDDPRRLSLRREIAALRLQAHRQAEQTEGLREIAAKTRRDLAQRQEALCGNELREEPVKAMRDLMADLESLEVLLQRREEGQLATLELLRRFIWTHSKVQEGRQLAPGVKEGDIVAFMRDCLRAVLEIAGPRYANRVAKKLKQISGREDLEGDDGQLGAAHAEVPDGAMRPGRG